jgi:Protein of unknown function (DUF3618)
MQSPATGMKGRIMAADHIDEPATIQRDVERTQDAMGETVQKLEDQLSPRKFAQSLFSDENAGTAQEAWDVVRQSPLPVAMIGGGLAWLLATSQAPMIKRLREELKARFRTAIDSASSGSAPNRSSESASAGPPRAAGEAFDRRPA